MQVQCFVFKDEHLKLAPSYTFFGTNCRVCIICSPSLFPPPHGMARLKWKCLILFTGDELEIELCKRSQR